MWRLKHSSVLLLVVVAAACGPAPAVRAVRPTPVPVSVNHVNVFPDSGTIAAGVVGNRPAFYRGYTGDTTRSDSSNATWGTVALGGGGEDLFGVLASVAHERSRGAAWPRQTIMGRILVMEEFCIFDCPRPARHLELSVLLGATTGTRLVTLTVAGGGAVIVGRPQNDGSGTNETFTTVGMPVVAELGVRPFSFVGLSAAGSVTFSPERTVPTLFFGLQFGSLHPRR